MDSTVNKSRISQVFGGYGWLLHALYWSGLILSQIVLYKSAVFDLSIPFFYKFLCALLSVITLAVLCYTFVFALLPWYPRANPVYFWLTLFALILSLHAGWAGLSGAIIHLYPGHQQLTFGTLFTSGFFRITVSFAIFISFYYFRDIYVRQQDIQMLTKFKTEKIALESSFLKSQVNPHFLFNTLNNIYALSLKGSAQTAVIIDKLESLMHYMLYDCKADFVSLEEEFNFNNSYIALEKLRHRDEQCVVTVNTEGEFDGQQIAPLLLINFLENAFKHGTKASFGKSWINMDIHIGRESLQLILENSKPLRTSPAQPISEYNGGIGLKNVKRRLEIIYPGKHHLSISDLKDRFRVELNLNF